MRIRDHDRIRRSRIRPSERVREHPTVTRADPSFTFHRGGQTWTYEDGRILLDGCEIAPMVSEEEPTVSTLIGLASGLGDYKVMVGGMRAKPVTAGKLVGLIDAFLEKILGKVKKVYDDKVYGLSWTLKNNELVINGVNIQSFLALYRVRKTNKARQFLKGLKGKIDMLVANAAGSWRNEKARRKILAIQREIDEELAHPAPNSASDHLFPFRNPGS